jgi:hypothetical protein
MFKYTSPLVSAGIVYLKSGIDLFDVIFDAKHYMMADDNYNYPLMTIRNAH